MIFKKGDKPDVYTILLIGDRDSGKSCLIKRFTEDTYSNEKFHQLTGTPKLTQAQCRIEKKDAKINLWETSTLEGLKEIMLNNKSGKKKIHGVMFVYDINNLLSFENIKHWIMHFDLIHRETAPSDCIKKILIGNKFDDDSDRKISFPKGILLANYMKISYIETSAKTGERLLGAFGLMVSLIKDERIATITKHKKNKKEKKSCTLASKLFCYT